MRGTPGQGNHTSAANGLLAGLPRRALQALAEQLAPVELRPGDVLCEAGAPIRWVYFPTGGLVSVLVPLEGGRVSEVAVVGREGIVGLPVLLGADAHPHRLIVQAAGAALRMPAAALRPAAERSPVLLRRLLRYADAFLVEITQSAVCNCRHSVPERYCRWLLMAHDRLGSDRLPLTLKFLSLLLTVRLASISEANDTLERAGLVQYRRGELQILDRSGLEAAACGCYRRIRDYFARLPA